MRPLLSKNYWMKLKLKFEMCGTDLEIKQLYVSFFILYVLKGVLESYSN